MKRRAHSAFSLLELLITLALLSIGLSIAIPAYSALKQKSEHAALRDQLHASLNHARLQAVLRRTTVGLCGSPDGLTCRNDWSQGWRIYLLNNPEQNLQIQQFDKSSTLRWAGFDKRLRFHDNGTTPTSNGRFFQCKEEQISWQLVINRQGRVRQASRAENQEEAHRCQQ
ncbi:pilus assembly protein FimT [Ectopseudomonas mendocina]|uniref:GspH/FimT family protein n=1 Tax=Ectopseudomonas hydrolytica TaxID=2493633 RepID=UPI000BC2DD40|nr:pilus assembly protein FimT [Pseudomonas mendocina]